MGGHAKYSAGPGPVPFPKVSMGHKWTARLLGGAMFFWICYRVREEGPVLLGWRHPWEHGSHGGHGDHKEEH